MADPPIVLLWEQMVRICPHMVQFLGQFIPSLSLSLLTYRLFFCQRIKR